MAIRGEWWTSHTTCFQRAGRGPVARRILCGGDVGISISFGILDIVNIAHPGFVILGSYIAYIVNLRLGFDPILISIAMLPAFYALGAVVYQVYYQSFEKRGQDALRGLAFFFGLLFVMRSCS